MAKNEEESEYLIDITGMLLSETLTPILPIYSPDGPPPGFTWGQVSPFKSRVAGVYNYEKNTDFEVEYVIESAPSYDYCLLYTSPSPRDS